MREVHEKEDCVVWGQCHQRVGTQVPGQCQPHRSPHGGTVSQGKASQAGRAWRDKDEGSVDHRGSPLGSLQPPRAPMLLGGKAAGRRDSTKPWWAEGRFAFNLFNLFVSLKNYTLKFIFLGC